MTAFTVHFEPPKEMPRSTFDQDRCQRYAFLAAVMFGVATFMGVITYLAYRSLTAHFQ